MPVQDTYTAELTPGYEGQRVDFQLTNIISKVAEDSDIPFGRAVVRGTLDNQAILPTATGQAFLGVTELTSAGNEDGSGLHLYEQYKDMNIIDYGGIYAYTEDSCVPGDSVFFRHTADTAPLDVIGRFRTDASGGDADQIIGATFESTTAAGGIAKIKINSPGLGATIAGNSYETLTATTSAISVLTGITYFDSTLGATAASLADGTEGQTKKVMLTVDGGDVIITPAHLEVGATLRLTEVGSSYTLLFTGTSWKVIASEGESIVTILATGAVPLDIDILLIDTVSTTAQALTLADGYPGQRLTCKMTVDAADSVLAPATFLDGTNITFDDAGDSAELIFDGTSWGVIGTATGTVA